MTRVVIDTNLLVALVDSRDKWYPHAQKVVTALGRYQVETMYLDCVLNETISVLARRAEEQKRSESIVHLLHDLRQQVPDTHVIWASLETRRLYVEIVDLVEQTQGTLNFHDALIALLCREWNIKFVVSFDKDFDQILWLKRIGKADDIASLLTITTF